MIRGGKRWRTLSKKTPCSRSPVISAFLRISVQGKPPERIEDECTENMRKKKQTRSKMFVCSQLFRDLLSHLKNHSRPQTQVCACTSGLFYKSCDFITAGKFLCALHFWQSFPGFFCGMLEQIYVACPTVGSGQSKEDFISMANLIGLDRWIDTII